MSEDDKAILDSLEKENDSLLMTARHVLEGSSLGKTLLGPFCHDHLQHAPAYTIACLEHEINITQKALCLFLNGDVFKAEALLQENCNGSALSLYPASGLVLMAFFKALISFDPQDVANALELLSKCFTAASHIKQTLSEPLYARVARIVGLRDDQAECKEQSEESRELLRLHADLVSSEARVLKAVLIIATDESGGWILLLREALALRECLQTYHDGWARLKSDKTAAVGAANDPHYRTGILLGYGIFNIMLALLPPRVAKVFAIFGYDGNVALGLELLRAGHACSEGIRKYLCSCTLLTFHLVLSHVQIIRGAEKILVAGQAAADDAKHAVSKEPLSISDQRHDDATEIVSLFLRKFPRGPVTLYFAGRLAFLKGDIPEALQWYQQIEDAQLDWPQYKHLAHWECLHCALYQLDWQRCSDLATRLAEETRWSQAFCTYLRGIFLHRLICMSSAKQPAYGAPPSDKVVSVLQHVQSMQKKVCGRSIPIEKFVGKRTRAVLDHSQPLFYPEIELILVWNGMHLVPPAGQSNIYASMKGAIRDDPLLPEHRAQAWLTLSAIHRVRKEYPQARQDIGRVLELASQLSPDSYAIPMAHLEQASVLLLEGRFAEAIGQYRMAEAYPPGYLLHKAVQLYLSNVKISLKNALCQSGQSNCYGNF